MGMDQGYGVQLISGGGIVELETTSEERLEVFQYGRRIAWLEPVRRTDLESPETLSHLARWHEDTNEGIRERVAAILGNTNRRLFWVKTLAGTPVGHVGLAGFGCGGARVEIDQLLRGEPGVLPGVMYAAVQSLLSWTFQTFAVREIDLRVSGDCPRLLRICQRCGFRPGDGGTWSMCRADWMSAHRVLQAA
jgi:RimJ/RimL family protein N-acetyltransferase